MNTKELMKIALELAGFDEEPFDTIISHPGEGIKKILIGVDMETPELMLAKELDYDLVVSHHPKADDSVIHFHKVMDIQIDRMVDFGVPINKAQKALSKKQKTVEIGMHVSNYDRVSAAAKLLDSPYMNIHLPADYIGEKFMQEYLNKEFENKPKVKIKEIIEAIETLDVYQKSLAKPVVRCGGPEDYAGRIAVLFAGGTNGGAEVYKAYFEAGVGTIVAMHAPEEVIKEVRDQNIGNIIVAGHMPSDSIGLNAIIKAWEEQGMMVTKISGIL